MMDCMGLLFSVAAVRSSLFSANCIWRMPVLVEVIVPKIASGSRLESSISYFRRSEIVID
jgi:hypothetical protein